MDLQNQTHGDNDMSKATLAGWYNSRARGEPEQPPKMSEILAEKGDFLEETLDEIDREDTNRGGVWAGMDMIDLIAHATDIDTVNRRILRDMRKSAAKQRLCRIIAGMYTRAVIAGDCGECERLADALQLATMDWCRE